MPLARQSHMTSSTPLCEPLQSMESKCPDGGTELLAGPFTGSIGARSINHTCFVRTHESLLCSTCLLL